MLKVAKSFIRLGSCSTPEKKFHSDRLQAGQSKELLWEKIKDGRGLASVALRRLREELPGVLDARHQVRGRGVVAEGGQVVEKTHEADPQLYELQGSSAAEQHHYRTWQRRIVEAAGAHGGLLLLSGVLHDRMGLG